MLRLQEIFLLFVFLLSKYLLFLIRKISQYKCFHYSGSLPYGADKNVDVS